MKSASIRSSISERITVTLLWLRSIKYCKSINAWFLSYSSDSMLAYLTINFLLLVYADWSGHYSGTKLHFNGLLGSTLVSIGLNLKGVIKFLLFPFSINSVSVWLSILIPKSIINKILQSKMKIHLWILNYSSSRAWTNSITFNPANIKFVQLENAGLVNIWISNVMRLGQKDLNILLNEA